MNSRVEIRRGLAELPSRTFRRALMAAVLFIGLAACGGTSSPAKQTTVDERVANGSVGVPELLQFTAPLVGGGEFAGAAYAGRATAFWFWAPT